MGTWSALATQPSFNVDTMLLLTDGTVMGHEFESANWHRLTPDAAGSYIHGSWSSLAPLPNNSAIPAAMGGPTNAPLYFAAAVLDDGTVFTAGGEYNAGHANADVLAAQVYDPLTNGWTSVSTPSGWTGIGDAASCVLADGRVLLANFSSGATALFDRATRTWHAGGAKGDSCSEETFTLLPNGNVLTVQCSNSPHAEQYVPSTNTWVTAGSTGVTLPQTCSGFVAEIGPAVLLPDGRVFAIGATGATALYTPNANATQAGTWANGPTLQDAHGNTLFPMDAPAVLLPNGKVLVTASPNPVCSYPGPTTFFEYDPSTNTATIVGAPSNASGACYTGRLLLLPTGQVLFSNHSNSVQVYTPDAGPQASWKPRITGCPRTLIAGQSFVLHGTQLNGRSQACSYGDDAQMATNYPIVRLSKASGRTAYLRTSHHSTMGVATGAAVVSTHVAVPSTLPTGQWTLVVVANGIASDPVAVTVVAPGRVGDVDGDGIAEIVVTSPWGIGIMKQAGGTMAALMMAPNGARFGGWLLNTADNVVGPVADYDGDGHAAILITSPWGIGILKLTGATLTAPMMAPNGTHFGTWVLDTAVDQFGPIGDYDGDGRVEILVSGPSGVSILKLSGATLVPLAAANNGTRLGGWLLDTSSNDFGPAADYDGDGHAEVLVTSPWGVGMLKAAGGALSAPMLQPNGSRFGGWLFDSAQNALGEPGDYDGDGHAEVLVTSAWGLGILKLAGTTMSAPMLQPNGTRFGGWLLNTADNDFGEAGDYDGDGRIEVLVTSPWGMGILKLSGATMNATMLQPNGTRFGGWLLNTADNRIGIAGRYAGGRQAEVLVTSPWGIGILAQAGATMSAPLMAANGTRFGGWLLNTADNAF